MGFRFSGTTGKVNLMSKYGATHQDYRNSTIDPILTYEIQIKEFIANLILRKPES